MQLFIDRCQAVKIKLLTFYGMFRVFASVKGYDDVLGQARLGTLRHFSLFLKNTLYHNELKRRAVSIYPTIVQLLSSEFSVPTNGGLELALYVRVLGR